MRFASANSGLLSRRYDARRAAGRDGDHRRARGAAAAGGAGGPRKLRGGPRCHKICGNSAWHVALRAACTGRIRSDASAANRSYRPRAAPLLRSGIFPGTSSCCRFSRRAARRNRSTFRFLRISRRIKPAAATIVNVFLCPSTVEDLVAATKGCGRARHSPITRASTASRATGTRITDPNAMQRLADQWLGVILYDEAVAPAQLPDGLSKTACIAETVLRRKRVRMDQRQQHLRPGGIDADQSHPQGKETKSAARTPAAHRWFSATGMSSSWPNRSSSRCSMRC